MSTQQAGMGGIIQGGYDSDVEGGNTYSDKAVSFMLIYQYKYETSNYNIKKHISYVVLFKRTYKILYFTRSVEASFGRCMEY